MWQAVILITCVDSLTHKSLWWPSTPGDSLVPDPDNATRNLSMASFSTTAFLLVLLKSRLLLQGSRIRKEEFLLVTNTEVHGRISTNLGLDSNFKRNRREVFQLVKIWDIQKEQDEKSFPLAKNLHFSANKRYKHLYALMTPCKSF